MSALGRRIFAFLVLAALVSALLTVAAALVLTDRSARAQRLGLLRRQADAAAGALEAAGAPARAPLRVLALRPGGRLRPLPSSAPRAWRLAAAVERAEGPEGTLDLDGRELLFVRRDTGVGPVAVVRAAGRLEGDVAPVGGILALARPRRPDRRGAARRRAGSADRASAARAASGDGAAGRRASRRARRGPRA